MYSLGWYADIPEGEVIGARIYEAIGSTRGALIAMGSIKSAGANSRWHDVPVCYDLEAGRDYDLEIVVNGVNSYDYWLDLTGMPYTANSQIQVRDGEQGGDETNAVLIHMRINNCSPPTATGVADDRSTTPPRFALQSPYPNPTRGRTEIPYSVNGTETVTIVVYDVAGRRVATLLPNSRQPAGPSVVQFDASRLSAGVYFVRLSTPTMSVSRKFTVVR